jgi:hypothetical protein
LSSISVFSLLAPAAVTGLTAYLSAGAFDARLVSLVEGGITLEPPILLGIPVAFFS